MNHSGQDSLETRILGWLDGDLPDAEIARLEAELIASPRARELYLQLAQLHSALSEQAAANKTLKVIPLFPVGRLLEQQRKKLVRNSLLAAAAVLMLTAVALWMGNARTENRPIAAFRLSPGAQIEVVHADPEAGGNADNTLAPGSRILISEGTLETRFASGVRLVAEAPCELTVIAADLVSLREGVAWFSVPQKARGFTVDTGQLRAVDLGTEFGVIANPGSPHELHVIRGLVEAGLSSGEGAKLRLGSGEAVKLEPVGVMTAMTSVPSVFPKTLPGPLPVANASFESDRNPSRNGDFQYGRRIDFGGELLGWISRSGSDSQVQVGFRGIPQSQLDSGDVATTGSSQCLTLLSGASVFNATSTRWRNLSPGDVLTLTVSMGLRAGEPPLDWNEGTSIALCEIDSSPDRTGIPAEVSSSGAIESNPATGGQHGDGSFRDRSISHVITAGDIRRAGSVGILFDSRGSGANNPAANQAMFDNVRLNLARGDRNSGHSEK